MARSPALPREAIYCYLLLLGVLLFQLRYIPPASEFKVLASHIQVLFFVAAALLSRNAPLALAAHDKRILLACAAFFVLALVSTVNSVDAAAAYARWYCYFAGFLLAMGVLLALRAHLVTVAGVFSIVLLASLVLVLAELRDVLQEWQMYREMNPNFLWMPLYFNHIRNFAHVPFAGLLLSVWLICTPAVPWLRNLGILLSIVFMTALLWSGGRAPLVVLPMAAALLYFLLPINAGRRVLAVWLLGAGISFGLLHASGNDFMLKKALERFEEDIVRVTELAKSDSHKLQVKVSNSQTISGLGTGRGKHWRRGMALWQEHPIIGNGGDAFFISSGYSFTHPHNWIVRMFMEFGVVGFALVSMILTTLLWPVLGLVRTNPAASIPLSVATTLVLGWLVYGALSGNLYFSWSLAVFSIATAIAGEAIGSRNVTDTASVSVDDGRAGSILPAARPAG